MNEIKENGVIDIKDRGCGYWLLGRRDSMKLVVI